MDDFTAVDCSPMRKRKKLPFNCLWRQVQQQHKEAKCYKSEAYVPHIKGCHTTKIYSTMLHITLKDSLQLPANYV